LLGLRTALALVTDLLVHFGWLVDWLVCLLGRSLCLSLVTHFAFVMAMPVVASPSFFFFFFLSTLLVLLHVSPIVAETEDRDPHLGTIRVVFQVLTLFVCLFVCLFVFYPKMHAGSLRACNLFVCLFVFYPKLHAGLLCLCNCWEE
jgi:hypothetical protein